MKCFELRMLYSSCRSCGQLRVQRTMRADCIYAYAIGGYALLRVGCGDRDAMRGEKKTSKYLAGRVDNLSRIILVLVSYQLAECVLNSRIVAVDKVAVNELHRQTRLSCAVSVGYFSHASATRSRSSNAQQLTDGSAAHNGHLPLLWCCRHLAAGFLVRSRRS